MEIELMGPVAPGLLATGDRQTTQLNPRVLKLNDLVPTQATDGSEAGRNSLQEVKDLVDTNMATVDLSFSSSRMHSLNGNSLNFQYDSGNFFIMQPPAFQTWKTGPGEGGVQVFAMNYHTANGISLITAKQSDHALVSYYLKTGVIISTSLKDSVIMGSHLPTSDNNTIPPPPTDPEKTVIFSAQQDTNSKGLAGIYAKRVYLDTAEIDINPARMPTAAGRVLTDKLGNGILSMEPVAGAGGVMVQQLKITVTKAQLLALSTTPLQAIAAPGANKIIQPLMMMAVYRFGTIKYQMAGNIMMSFDTVGNMVVGNIFITFQDHSTMQNVPITGWQSNDITTIVNLPLLITLPGGSLTEGDGELDIYVTYTILTM